MGRTSHRSDLARKRRRVIWPVAAGTLGIALVLAAGSARDLTSRFFSAPDPDPSALELADEPSHRWPTLEKPCMGTLFSVTLNAENTAEARAAIEAAFSHFDHVDQVMSEWRPDSPVSQVNDQAGRQPVPVPEDLFHVLEAAQRISAASDGAFDVTWAALRGLWRFDGTDRVPGDAEIAARLPNLGFRGLELDPAARTARLAREGMAIGLGGIAKGYALELAAGELRRRGFHHFLLNAGGQVYGGGDKGTGGDWRVGVREPRGGEEDFFAVIRVRDGSVSTSGDYEHSFFKDGVRYHHIIDVRTGRPARKSVSATVLSADPLLADACSTAAFILGPEDGLEFARKMGVELLLVDPAGSVHMTDGMKSHLASSRPPGKITP